MRADEVVRHSDAGRSQQDARRVASCRCNQRRLCRGHTHAIHLNRGAQQSDARQAVGGTCRVAVAQRRVGAGRHKVGAPLQVARLGKIAVLLKQRAARRHAEHGIGHHGAAARCYGRFGAAGFFGAHAERVLVVDKRVERNGGVARLAVAIEHKRCGTGHQHDRAAQTVARGAGDVVVDDAVPLADNAHATASSHAVAKNVIAVDGVVVAVAQRDNALVGAKSVVAHHVRAGLDRKGLDFAAAVGNEIALNHAERVAEALVGRAQAQAFALVGRAAQAIADVALFDHVVIGARRVAPHHNHRARRVFLGKAAAPHHVVLTVQRQVLAAARIAIVGDGAVRQCAMKTFVFAIDPKRNDGVRNRTAKRAFEPEARTKHVLTTDAQSGTA